MRYTMLFAKKENHVIFKCLTYKLFVIIMIDIYNTT